MSGPLRIPKVYNGTRRTNFQFTYSGNQSHNLFDQYATVPNEAVRSGDFSSTLLPVVDPLTGLPFPDNVIPANRISPGSRVLLDYLPQANLPGTTRNYHYSTTTDSSSNNVSVRVTHNFSAPPAGARGGGPGRGGAGGGRGGGGAGPQGRAAAAAAAIRARP